MKVVFSIDVYLSESGQSSQLTSQIAEVEKDRQPQCEEDAKRVSEATFSLLIQWNLLIWTLLGQTRQHRGQTTLLTALLTAKRG